MPPKFYLTYLSPHVYGPFPINKKDIAIDLTVKKTTALDEPYIEQLKQVKPDLFLSDLLGGKSGCLDQPNPVGIDQEKN